MKEENNDVSKKNWRQIFRKKWFFPAVYLTVTALLLTVVIWYQTLDNQLPEVVDEEADVTDNYVPTEHNGDVESVMDQQEVIQMPVAEDDQAEIVTKFYDYSGDEEDQENALIFHDSNYHQSTGIDITVGDGESFDVLASLSGTVYDVKPDPLLGNVVILSHDHDVMTYYASLTEPLVEKNDEVEQGDVLANAGNNVLGEDNGTHAHFEIRVDDEPFNPETYFTQPISKLDSATDEDNNEEERDPAENEEDPAEEEEEPQEELESQDDKLSEN